MDGVGPTVIPSVEQIRKKFNQRRQGVGTLDKLPAIIDALINAVRAGELDTQIKEAAVARGLMMAERRKKKAA